MAEYAVLKIKPMLETGIEQLSFIREAMHETIRRYGKTGDVEGALIFFWGASGIGLSEPTAEDMEWAEKAIGSAG